MFSAFVSVSLLSCQYYAMCHCTVLPVGNLKFPSLVIGKVGVLYCYVYRWKLQHSGFVSWQVRNAAN